jgi:hypothetical protein
MPDQKSLFLLPEYDVALKRFIHTTINLLMRKKDPVLGMIPTERKESVTTTQNTMPSGEVVKGAPLLTEMKFEINNADVLEGNVDGFIASIDGAAEDGVKKLMPQIFGRIGALAEAAGTASNAGGQPISHELVLAQYEKMEIDFDERGNPILPTMVGSPEMIEAYKRLGEPSAEIEERFQKMIARKREEFNARRRSRKLP